jgi:hypothetical protein
MYILLLSTPTVGRTWEMRFISNSHCDVANLALSTAVRVVLCVAAGDNVGIGVGCVKELGTNYSAKLGIENGIVQPPDYLAANLGGYCCVYIHVPNVCVPQAKHGPLSIHHCLIQLKSAQLP